MPKVQDADLLQLGGLNSGPPASNIDDTEFSVLENWLPMARGRIKTRPGTVKLTSTAYGEAVTSLFPYSPTTGSWTLIAGTVSGLAKLSGTELVAIPKSGAAYASTNSPWRHRQYKDILYSVREGVGVMQRSDGSYSGDAGIDAPTTAPTVADGGAGNLGAGDYTWVYTYYNEATGQESNYSPASSALTLAASHKASLSAIVPSTNVQVTHIRIYRSLVNQEGAYFFSGQIIASATTYEDNVAQSSLDTRASTGNGVPPSSTHLIEIFGERIWLSDGTSVYFSELGMGESFRSTSVINVFPDDGHTVRVLHAFGARLIVGKSNSVHYITGTDRESFAVTTLADRDGCPAGDSMASGSGYLFWFTGTKVIQSQGSGVRDISTPFIEDLLARIPTAYYHKIRGQVNTKLSLYVLDVPLDDATSNTHRLVFNYESNRWATFRYNSGTEAPSVSQLMYDSDGKEVLYGTFPSTTGHVYDLLSGTTDDGTAFDCTWRTKAFMFQAPGRVHGVRSLSVLTSPAVGASMTFSVFQNHSTTAYKSRIVSIDSDGWKRINLSTMGKLSSLTQFQGVYSGEEEVTMLALATKLVGFMRRPVVL